ncbi:zinc dependent phospholipase C family protein [candidate division KSB1 bacterium]|nr:zinc dependent phospholipase C family protein [candidate division KSB1 bacterium]
MAGPRTHIEIGAILWEKYVLPREDIPDELKEVYRNPDVRAAFLAGCIFPDWGYDGINKGAAEDSHWQPFRQVLFDYINNANPLSESPDRKRLMAFYMGVLTHSVSDDLWHFSGENHTSFIEMAKIKDNAEHRPVEVACDVFCHSQCPFRRLHGALWWPPIETLCSVYEKRNFNVTPDELVAGFRKLEHQLKKGARLGWLAYPYYRIKFPWAHANYRENQHGGIRHGARVAADAVLTAFSELP